MLGNLVLIHERLAQTAWLFLSIMGIWAFISYLRNRPLGGNFFGTVAIGEILLIVQATLGFIIALTSDLEPERPGLHYLYGVFALLVLPAIYYYTRGDHSRRAALVWALTGLFMFGLILRLITMAAFV